MKLTISKKALVGALSAVVGAAAKKPSMPSLSSILFDANESGSLTFTATDLYTGVRARAAGAVAEGGMLLVPVSQFMTAAKALPDGDIALRLDGNRIEMKSGKLKQRIPWSPAIEFPDLPQMKAEKSVGLSASTLLLAISSVAHSVSTDPNRANMCGVEVQIGGGLCRAIATNGHTLSRRDVECTVDGFSVLIPQPSVTEIRRLLESGKDEAVNVATHDGYVFVERGDIALSAKLSGEVFPAHYEKIIPKKNRHRAVLNRDALLDAVNCVRTQDGGLPIELRFEAGAISLHATHERGDAAGSVDADYAGPDLSIGLLALYLSNALSAMTATEVALESGGVLDPFMIVPAESADAVQIIMPTRL